MTERPFHVLTGDKCKSARRRKNKFVGIGRDAILFLELENEFILGTDDIGKYVSSQDGNFGSDKQPAKMELRREQESDQRAIHNPQSAGRRSGQRLGQDDESKEQQRRIKNRLSALRR